MNTSLKRQQGMTMISMTCIGIVVGAIFFLAIAILPIYMEHGKLTSALESLKEDPEAPSETPDLISMRLFKMLSINNFDAITPKDVEITREATGGTSIHVRYDVTKKLVGNVSILIEFDDSVEIS